MSLVRSKDTQPELRVRRLIHALGYRYRIHVRGLPGCPDMVFHSRRKIIFVHGCFWHQHNCTMGKRVPKSRIAFWREKLQGNKKRDYVISRRLISDGWSILIVWECMTIPRKMDALSCRIVRFLNADNKETNAVRARKKESCSSAIG
jgi:DNA mismatch endonuclease (patch repair protein)